MQDKSGNWLRLNLDCLAQRKYLEMQMKIQLESKRRLEKQDAEIEEPPRKISNLRESP